MKDFTDSTGCLVACIVIFVLAILGLALIQPYMEAKTYTKLTGKEVSTWDAMWVDLRITND